jgi:hypothetical protein
MLVLSRDRFSSIVLVIVLVLVLDLRRWPARKEKKNENEHEHETSELVRQLFFRFYLHVYSQFRGVFRREFGRSLNREFGELGSSAVDRTGCAVSNKRRGSGSI